MGSLDNGKPNTWMANMVTVWKDLVSLLRDASLLLVVILLVLFPDKFNSILVNAGFEEGSLVGLKWKAKVVETDDALKDALATIERVERENNALYKALDEARQKLTDVDLVAKLNRLEGGREKLEVDSRQIQEQLTSTIEANAPYVQKALESTSKPPKLRKSEFLVGLQTVGVPNDVRIAINQQLQKQGYSLDDITYSYEAGERPPWFAYKSTVFYYSYKSQQAAEELAEFMQSVTGENFEVNRGAGLGVDADKKEVTFFIHYIGG